MQSKPFGIRILFAVIISMFAIGLVACGPRAIEPEDLIPPTTAPEVDEGIAPPAPDEADEAESPAETEVEESVVPPAVEETTDEPEMVEETMDEDTMAEEAHNDDDSMMTEETESDAAVENTTTDELPEGVELYNGVPVGFTENGNAYMGNLDAPVTIAEYSDYQCPFCQRFVDQALTDLKGTEIANGDAVLIFHDFPLSFHPQAAAAANAARCAGEAGAAAYWGMHDALFENFGDWSVSDPIPQFVSYAQQIGVEIEAFTECVETDRYGEDVKADTASGSQKGVRGTPAFLVNGELLSGAQPYGVFTQAIARAASGESIAEEQPEQAAVADEDIPEPEAIELSDNYAFAIGDPDAETVIVEYTDLQCPFCARHSADTLPALIENFVETGRVRYEFRDLPLDQLHPLARQAAVIARCAGEQDKYVEMHKLLFENQQEWGAAGLDNTQINYATDLELDIPAFEECAASGKFDQAIEDSVQEALQYSLNSTPYFVVNGFPVVRGAQPLENFEYVIQLVEEGGLENAIVEAQRRQAEAQQQQEQQQQQQQQEPVNVGEVPEGDSFVLGDPDAPVTIVEYTDYQCPFCARHYTDTFGQIKENFIDKGLVRYVFKDFPLNFHPEADEAAVSAHCAQEQNAFLEMHDMLFQNQGGWGGQQDVYTLFASYAEELGLDVEAFNTCVNSGKYESVVQADFQEGSGFGVRGTPAFFVDGEFVNGAQPFTVFQQVIQSKLDG